MITTTNKELRESIKKAVIKTLISQEKAKIQSLEESLFGLSFEVLGIKPANNQGQYWATVQGKDGKRRNVVFDKATGKLDNSIEKMSPRIVRAIEKAISNYEK